MSHHEQLPLTTSTAVVPSWPRLVEEYRTALKSERKSVGTIRLYTHYVNQLTRVPFPLDASASELRRLMARETWGGESMASARAAWRSFYGWACEVGYCVHDPSALLKPVSKPDGIPNPAPEHVVLEVVATPVRRIELMARLAANGGLRCAEISRVHRNDLSRDDILTVRGKGDKTRLVPITDPILLDQLRALTGWAFPSVDARGVVRDHLSAGYVSRLMAEAMPDGWTAHTLRHRMATNALDGSGDLLVVAQLLGHRDINTTRRYTAVSTRRLRAVAQHAAIGTPA